MRACLAITCTALLFPLGSTRCEPRDIIVLPDVSGSVAYVKERDADGFPRNATLVAKERAQVLQMIEDGLALVYQLSDGTLSPVFAAKWQWDESLLAGPVRAIVNREPGADAMCSNSKRVIVQWFGDLSFQHQPQVSPPLTQFPADFRKFVFDHYPARLGDYRDRNTYLMFGKARTAAVAEQFGIRNYYFFMVTDATNDPKGAYSDEPLRLIQRWDSNLFVKDHSILGIFRYNVPEMRSRNFQVEVWKVDLDIVTHASVVLRSPASGTRPEPGKVAFEWGIQKKGETDVELPPGVHFQLMAADLATGDQVDAQSVTQGYTGLLEFPRPGSYRVVIEAATLTNAPEATPRSIQHYEGVVEIGRSSTLRWVTPVLNANGILDVPVGETEVAWEWEGPPGPSPFRITLAEKVGGRILINNQEFAKTTGKLLFPSEGNYVLQLVAGENAPLAPQLSIPVVVTRPPPEPSPAPPASPPQAGMISFTSPLPGSKLKSGSPVTFSWRTSGSSAELRRFRFEISGPEPVRRETSTKGLATAIRKPGHYRASVVPISGSDVKIQGATVEFTVVNATPPLLQFLVPAVLIGALFAAARSGLLGSAMKQFAGGTPKTGEQS